MPTGEICKLINDDHKLKLLTLEPFEHSRGSLKRREPFKTNCREQTTTMKNLFPKFVVVG